MDADRRAARAFRRRRWTLARKHERSLPTRAAVAVLSAVLAPLVPFDSTPLQALAGVVCGLLALAIWEYVLVPMHRFVFVVPVDEHVALHRRIRELEQQINSRGSGLLDDLTQLHREGEAIRNRIRKDARKPWDGSQKVAASAWESSVNRVLDRHAPQLRGRFTNDIPRSPQQYQPKATPQASNWANFMDRRLDNLQTIIEEIAVS